MNNNLTKLVFILDCSGSMHSLANDTIGGFNSLIDEQRGKEGECEVTTILFESTIHKLYENVPIKEVPEMTTANYRTGGCTAMLDAVGQTIDEVGQELAARSEEDRPGKVIFVITTDGYENASQEYTQSMVKERIEHQQSKYNWVFMFLGANIDAEQVGASYGIKSGYSKTYTASKVGAQSVYLGLSKGVSSLRCSDMCFMDDDSVATAVTDALKDVK